MSKSTRPFVVNIWIRKAGYSYGEIVRTSCYATEAAARKGAAKNTGVDMGAWATLHFADGSGREHEVVAGVDPSERPMLEAKLAEAKAAGNSLAVGHYASRLRSHSDAAQASVPVYRSAALGLVTIPE